jgi:hypothetical protein
MRDGIEKKRALSLVNGFFRIMINKKQDRIGREK